MLMFHCRNGEKTKIPKSKTSSQNFEYNFFFIYWANQTYFCLYFLKRCTTIKPPIPKRLPTDAQLKLRITLIAGAKIRYIKYAFLLNIKKLHNQKLNLPH